MIPNEYRERFFKNIRKDEKTGHWMWIGSVTKGESGGYPRIMIKRQLIQGLQLSYMVSHDMELEDVRKLVLKSLCGVLGCVAPRHILALPKRKKGG